MNKKDRIKSVGQLMDIIGEENQKNIERYFEKKKEGYYDNGDLKSIEYYLDCEINDFEQVIEDQWSIIKCNKFEDEYTLTISAKWYEEVISDKQFKTKKTFYRKIKNIMTNTLEDVCGNQPDYWYWVAQNYTPPEEYPDWDGDESIMYYLDHWDDDIDDVEPWDEIEEIEEVEE